MIKYFKIKVGIEEFSVNENDIPRIVEAMKTNEMVKLDCGIFRGQAILALTRDIEREEKERLDTELSSTEEKKQKTINEEIEKQISECDLCNKKGYTIVDKRFPNGSPNPVVKKCSCTIYRGVENVDMPHGSCPA